MLRTSSPSAMLQVIAEDDDADRVLFEVERQADRAVGELDHLLGHDAGEAVDAGDAVADFQHAADVADVDLRREVLDFLLDDGGDFVAIEFHDCLHCRSGFSLTRAIACSSYVDDVRLKPDLRLRDQKASGRVSICSVARSIIARRACSSCVCAPSRRTRGRRRGSQCRRSATGRPSRCSTGSSPSALRSRFSISLAKRIIERRGDADFDVGHAAALGVELLQHAANRPQDAEPTVAREHLQEIEHSRRRLAAEDAVEQLLLLLLGQRATS